MLSMTLRSRRNPLHFRHVALMLVLAFGLVAQSLLGVIGDLHESVLHADAGEAYTHQHAPDLHHDGDTRAEDPGTGGAFHLLQHQSCGGHCAWMAGASLRIPTPSLLTSVPPMDVAQRLASNDYTAPFRPPIQG